jgi:inhibitor of cysteine peptidase
MVRKFMLIYVLLLFYSSPLEHVQSKSLSDYTPKFYTIPSDNSGKSYLIKAKKNWEIQLKIHGNPTTGYGWYLSEESIYNKSQLEPANLNEYNSTDDYQSDPAPQGTVGMGGSYKFKFHTLDSGTNKLTFINKRPWEKEDVGKFTVHIRTR